MPLYCTVRRRVDANGLIEKVVLVWKGLRDVFNSDFIIKYFPGCVVDRYKVKI